MQFNGVKQSKIRWTVIEIKFIKKINILFSFQYFLSTGSSRTCSDTLFWSNSWSNSRATTRDASAPGSARIGSSPRSGPPSTQRSRYAPGPADGIRRASPFSPSSSSNGPRNDTSKYGSIGCCWNNAATCEGYLRTCTYFLKFFDGRSYTCDYIK